MIDDDGLRDSESLTSHASAGFGFSKDAQVSGFWEDWRNGIQWKMYH